uniref:G_PROTEIN_RECEP_F1_2 domain-containing protein n=1 Tax=Steinernema glaseri TaxID=37863 RepID=A0A1I8AKR6_9BILA
MSGNNTTTFTYGSELQGRGEPTATDILVGSFMFTVSFAAVVLGLLNLYLIRKMEIFHNAFGWFWASRTVAEIFSNFSHVVYSAPITIMQLTDVPMVFGMTVAMIGYICGVGGCVLHQIVSMNRCIAVALPFDYKRIFSPKNAKIIIFWSWIFVLFLTSFFFVVPCSMLGYSPKFYQYSFMACSSEPERDHSIVSTVLNRACLALCWITVSTDLITLYHIIKFKRKTKFNSQNATFNRDVRFFKQTTIQNITMIMATTMIVVANNNVQVGSTLVHLLGFSTLHITHVNNAYSGPVETVKTIPYF